MHTITARLTSAMDNSQYHYQNKHALFQPSIFILAFGPLSAPATFSCLTRKVLEHVDNFLDDILEDTEDWSSHLDVLEKICHSLRKANLTAKPAN